MKMTGNDTQFQAADGTTYQKMEGFFEVAEQHIAAALKAGLIKAEHIADVLVEDVEALFASAPESKQPDPVPVMTQEILEEAAARIVDGENTLEYTVAGMSSHFNELPEHVEAELRKLLPEGFGPDTTEGGAGTDSVQAGVGNDTVEGAGTDSVQAGVGNDTVEGAAQ